MNHPFITVSVRNVLADAGRELHFSEIVGRLAGPAYGLGRTPPRLIWRCLQHMVETGVLKTTDDEGLVFGFEEEAEA